MKSWKFILTLLILTLTFFQEGYTGTYGEYTESFRGYSARIPINIGSYSNPSAEGPAYKEREKRARETILRLRPILDGLMLHYLEAEHPFRLLTKQIDLSATKASWKTVGIRLDDELFIDLHVLQSTSPEILNNLAAHYVAAQFFANGLGTKPLHTQKENLTLDTPDSGTTPEKFLKGPYQLSSLAPETNGYNLFRMMRATWANKTVNISKGDTSELALTNRILKTVLDQKPFETELFDDIYEHGGTRTKDFLIFTSQLASDTTRKDTMTRLLERGARRLSIQFDAGLSKTLAELARLQNAPLPTIDGHEWIEKLKKSLSSEENDALIRRIRESELPITGADKLLRAALKLPKATGSISSVQMALTDAKTSIPGIDGVFNDLIDNSESSVDYNLLAIQKNTQLQGKRGLFVLRQLKKIEYEPSSIYKMIEQDITSYPNIEEIISEVIKKPGFRDPRNLVEFLGLPQLPLEFRKARLLQLLEWPQLGTQGRERLYLALNSLNIPEIKERLAKDVKTLIQKAVSTERVSSDDIEILATVDISPTEKDQILAPIFEDWKPRGRFLGAFYKALGAEGLLLPQAEKYLKKILEDEHGDYEAADGLLATMALMNPDQKKRFKNPHAYFKKIATSGDYTSYENLEKLVELLPAFPLSSTERKALAHTIEKHKNSTEATKEKARTLF